MLTGSKMPMIKSDSLFSTSAGVCSFDSEQEAPAIRKARMQQIRKNNKILLRLFRLGSDRFFVFIRVEHEGRIAAWDMPLVQVF